MNEISLARAIIYLNRLMTSVKCGLTYFNSAANSQSIAMLSFSILIFCVCRVEANVTQSKDCIDAQGLTEAQSIDSTRIGLSKNSPRIVYSGTGNVFSTKKSIDYTKRKPDFCLRYVISEKPKIIDSFTICYKFKKINDELSSSFGVGFGHSNLSDRKALTSITSFIDRSDTSIELINHFSITSRKFNQELKVILTYDSVGISTLSNISDSFDVSITKIDCKQNKTNCKPSYAF